MGLNIMVETLDGKSHPKWDDGKFAGDRELPEKLRRVPNECRRVNDDWFERPTDFGQFRCVLQEYDVNEDRWTALADLLEASPDFWIRFCA